MQTVELCSVFHCVVTASRHFITNNLFVPRRSYPMAP